MYSPHHAFIFRQSLCVLALDLSQLAVGNGCADVGFLQLSTEIINLVVCTLQLTCVHGNVCMSCGAQVKYDEQEMWEYLGYNMVT